jgi:hypothetical protein
MPYAADDRHDGSSSSISASVSGESRGSTIPGGRPAVADHLRRGVQGDGNLVAVTVPAE